MYDSLEGLQFKMAEQMRPSAGASNTDKSSSRFKLLVDKQRTDLSAQNRTVQNRVSALQENWDKLNDLLSQRKTKLEEAIQSQQVRMDSL